MSTWNERHPAPVTEDQALELLVEEIKKARYLSDKKRAKLFNKAARDQANYLIHRSESTGYCKSCLTRQFHEVILEQYNKVQLEIRTTNAQFQHPARRN